jgi:hypothetical protein
LAPSNRGAFNSTHIHGTRVPVEEPSTASTAVVSRCSKRSYSITSAAVASSVGGTVRSSVDLISGEIGNAPDPERVTITRRR